MGTNLKSIRNADKHQNNLHSKKKKKRSASARSNFTGRKQLREEDLEDIDDMTPEEIRSLLVK